MYHLQITLYLANLFLYNISCCINTKLIYIYFWHVRDKGDFLLLQKGQKCDSNMACYFRFENN